MGLSGTVISSNLLRSAMWNSSTRVGNTDSEGQNALQKSLRTISYFLEKKFSLVEVDSFSSSWSCWNWPYDETAPWIFFPLSHASFIKFNLFFVHFVMVPYNLEKVNPKIRPNAYFPIKEGIKWRVENFRPYITIIIFALKN